MDKSKNIAKPHTIKKFELIELYVRDWIHKLLNNDNCSEIVFVDCMCNSGIYEDERGNYIEGTPIRIARIVAAAMKNYSSKKAALYFNDRSEEKIAELRNHLPADTANFHIHISCRDGNDLLNDLQIHLTRRKNLHYLIFYDPYEADINWFTLEPYFFGWGELIINHMILDSVRAIRHVKTPKKIRKYENTYLMTIEDLLNFGSNRTEYERRVKDIIKNFRGGSDKKYYTARFPFFNRANSLVYDIIFFTNNPTGFTTFKKAVWKTFGGKSSNKNTHGKENQLSLFEDFENPPDEYCYTISDIAEYLIDCFKPRRNVPLNEIWDLLKIHPIFPDAFKKEIKSELEFQGCKINRSSIDFFRGENFE